MQHQINMPVAEPIPTVRYCAASLVNGQRAKPERTRSTVRIFGSPVSKNGK